MPVAPAYRPDPRHQTLGPLFYDVVRPADFPSTILRYRNQRWAAAVGLDPLSDAEWIAHFARFEPLPENLSEPLALRYHGHQFRVYNPELGDGRGFLFAQLRDGEGRLLDLATKGSGQTPYCRGADGRLTLKGGVREALATEMLEARGVYTSKSLSLIETGEALQRHDEPSPTRSAVLVRLGHSHVRFGTFQRLAAHGETDAIRQLVDYCIEQYWPEAATDDDPLIGFYRRVVGATARLAAQWTAAGFVHGVLNTDNTLITGESFDYGPWRFLPTLDADFTAAYFDQSGLYAFGRQPAALQWNLARLGECLLLIAEREPLETALAGFERAFETAFAAALHRRLALKPSGAAQTDTDRANALFSAMAAQRPPFERVFFDLIGGARPGRIEASPQAATYAGPGFAEAIALLRDADPIDDIDAVLASPALDRAEPIDMLIDEVEALWAPIADRDDWSAFEAKLADIALLRAANDAVA